MRLKVRERSRRSASPKEGLEQEWTEWQVVSGNTIMSRHDTKGEAQEMVARMEAFGGTR